MGSKRKIAKEILPIILEGRKSSQWYVEPFCGGCNSLDKVSGKRIGSDINKYLIALLKEMQKDDFEIPFIGEEKYKDMQKNNDKYPNWLLGYTGFQLSFGAKWFGGYRRDKIGIRNYETEAQNNLKKQRELLKDVLFYCCPYHQLDIPENSIIYCDPPYESTTNYKDVIDYKRFWNWCKEKTLEGHKVFVSEYHAPEGWESVWSKKVTTMLDVHNYKDDTENLFVFTP
jgi:DNA adenine methylase